MPSDRSINVGGRRSRRAIASLGVVLTVTASSPASTLAFSTPRTVAPRQKRAMMTSHLSSTVGPVAAVRDDVRDGIDASAVRAKRNGGGSNLAAKSSLLALAIASAPLAITLSSSPLLGGAVQPANAYEESDYASETVTNVVSRLRSSAGDEASSFDALEEVAKIVTEGKGVGGTLTYGASSPFRFCCYVVTTRLFRPTRSFGIFFC